MLASDSFHCEYLDWMEIILISIIYCMDCDFTCNIVSSSWNFPPSGALALVWFVGEAQLPFLSPTLDSSLLSLEQRYRILLPEISKPPATT